MFTEYEGSPLDFEIFKPNVVVKRKKQLALQKVKEIGVTNAKKNDVLSLMNFIEPENRKFYKNLFENCKTKETNDSDDYESE